MGLLCCGRGLYRGSCKGCLHQEVIDIWAKSYGIGRNVVLRFLKKYSLFTLRISG